MTDIDHGIYASTLVIADKAVLEMMRIDGIAASDPMLSIEAVEQLYQRFAAVVSGAPATQMETDLYAAHAATIVILREPCTISDTLQ